MQECQARGASAARCIDDAYLAPRKCFDDYVRRVAQLVLENPIGLEDYRQAGVPARSFEQVYENELAQTPEKIPSVKKTYAQFRMELIQKFLERSDKLLAKEKKPVQEN